MSSELADLRELGCFQLPGIVHKSFNMGPCIIMSQHEMMVVDERHNNGPQDLITVSLYIHNVDISKLLTHTVPYTHSA